MIRNSPLLEGFKSKGINVLICDEEIDTIVLPMVNEFDSTPLKSINSSEIDSEMGQNQTKASDETNALIVKIKEFLKDEVKDVKISNRLSDSVSCLIYDKNDPDYAMQSLLKQMGQEAPKIKPILEINPNHEIIIKLANNELMINDVAILLLNMAKISEGMAIENPSEFSAKLAKIISKAL